MKAIRFLIFLFLLTFGTTLFFLNLSGPAGERVDESLSITVASGDSMHDVAKTLKDHGIITSAIAFRLYMKSKELDTGVQPGLFTIPEGATFAEIADLLSEGGSTQTSVTIPEGYTLAQIDALLAKNELMSEGALLECACGRCDFETFDFLPSAPTLACPLEGYLFPDTYFVDVTEFVPKFFLERMMGTFRQKVVSGLKEDFDASGRSLHEIITMASLIERETRSDDERAVIAGILWKRYDADQGLAVDATVRYALGKITEPLTRADLDTDSPYNTRKYRGLPPGPIANPGMKSIEAALHPEESPYWYYLHGSDGMIRYAETNDGHNENKARYL